MKVRPSTRSKRGVVTELGSRKTQLPRSRKEISPTPLAAFRLNRILVPMDFSECARKSLEYAIPMARQFGASVTLLFVVQPYMPVSDMMPLDVETIELRIRETSEKELAKLRKSLPKDVPAETVLRVGNPHVEIVRAAQELGIDLIILSTHGRTGFSHVVMGSTTERVVRHANCPVLVLREHEHEFVVG